MLKNLLLMIFVFWEVTAFCQSDPLKDFGGNDFENWPVDSSTIKYEKTRNTKLRSLDDCIREIKSQDLIASELNAIEKRMGYISIIIIHQYYPTFIVDQKDLENIKDLLKGCDVKFLIMKESRINTKVKIILNAFNRKTISYLEAVECSNKSELRKLSSYLIKN